MDLHNLEDFTILPRKYNRHENVLSIWENRLSRKIKETKSFTKRLEYVMAIMNVKYPFLEESQCRGRALAIMNIPSFMGQIPTLRTLYQLASSKSKPNAVQMASEVHPKKNKAKQDLKARSKNDIITKKTRVRVQIYEDPGESNEDYDQSQKSQNHYSELHNICKDIQNIPSKIGRKMMISDLSISLGREIEPNESSLDIHMRNIQNITKKRNRVKKEISKEVRSSTGTKEQRIRGTKGNENVEVEIGVMKRKMFCTPLCRTKKCQENKTVKDSETEENEEDIPMSEVNTERMYIQQEWQIKNNNSTLGKDLPSSTTKLNKTSNRDNSDFSNYIPSFVDESTTQTSSGSDELPQHSPVYYVLSDTYSSSQKSQCDTEDAQIASGGEEVYSVPPYTLQKRDTFLPNMRNPLSMIDEDTVRSVSHRTFYKTYGHGSDNNIPTTTQTTEDTILTGMPTGNTNSSSDSNVLSDMFDWTT